MTDWKLIASALEPTIPEADRNKIPPVMEALETAFGPLVRSIPAGANVWTGPEDAE